MNFPPKPRFDLHLWSLLTVIILLCISLFKPAIKVNREIFNFIFVVDITQSMNAKDYQISGLPAERLSFVKQSMLHSLQELPCHSRIGLGLFTTKNMFLLFEPLEICDHYNVIEKSINEIDWRMAWAANSHIARGLYTSIRDINKLESKPKLVFFSDGQQTPASAKQPPFILEQGIVPGIIMGVGHGQGVPVPKLDKNNIRQGYWQISEVESHSGNNVNSKQSSKGDYLTSVQENHLKHLAGITGLQYQHLTTPKQFTQVLLKSGLGQDQIVLADVGWILVVIALLLLIIPYLGKKN